MTPMRLAVSLSRRALGLVSPNPPVGAVVAREGEILGEGWTQPPGGPHAEIVALQQAGERAAGATLYTTLEPCNHHGRTPPCTEAIIEAGIAAVQAAARDPNPLVTGGGLARLEKAGVRTVIGQDEGLAREVMEGYLKFAETGTPFVTAKFAMSLDGKIATRTGNSKWISGDRARRFAHELRDRSDAVMVGVGTVLADDPQLTSRNGRGLPLDRQPLRVIVDSQGKTPHDARLLREPGLTLVAVASNDTPVGLSTTLERVEAEVVPAADGRIDLEEMMRLLGRREITSLLVEGGGTLLGSLFDLGLVDKVVAFVSPTIVGGVDALSPVGGKGFDRMADALRLDRVKWRRFGRDLAIIGYC